MEKNSFKIHVITGDGQGKTTASLGLVLRAIGAKKKVKIIHFLKKAGSSEHNAIKEYNLPIEIEAYGIGFFKILGDNKMPAEHIKAAQKGLEAAGRAISGGKYDLIVLDEINVAVGFGLLDIKEVITVINMAKSGDIVLTGRRAHPELKKIAHRVSDIKNVKNYFDKGFKARKGIEY